MNEVRVNWAEISDLSIRTLNNCEAFEKARSRYQAVINDLYSCWQGSDADTFVLIANDFLEYLKGNTNYLESMSKIFDKSSRAYSGVVEENSERFKRFNQLLEEKKNKLNIDEEA